MKHNFEYDLAVIGGGTGGLAAALHAASLGARTVLIEKAKIGGRNLWGGGRATSGTLIQSARVMATASRSNEFGVHIENTRLIWSAVRLRIAAVRDDIRANQQQRLKAAGVAQLAGTARFTGAHTLAVTAQQGETAVSAARFVLAPGTENRAPLVPGLAEAGCLSLGSLFELQTLPHSLAIIGGTAEGCEVAQALARLGRTITLVEEGPRLLPNEDEELSEWALKTLRQDGVRVHCGVRLTEAGQAEKSWLKFTDGDSAENRIEASRLVLAVEREARLSGLCLELPGVQWDERGIVVDEALRTTAPHIHACGSAAGALPHRDMTLYQARVAAGNAYSGARTRAGYRAAPSLTFLEPQLARAGMTESEAASKGPYRVHRAAFDGLDRAIIDGETQGFIKLIASPGGRILGAHLAGPHAGELIHIYAAAVREGALIQEVAEAPYAPLSFSEIAARAAPAATP